MQNVKCHIEILNSKLKYLHLVDESMTILSLKNEFEKIINSISLSTRLHLRLLPFAKLLYHL